MGKRAFHALSKSNNSLVAARLYLKLEIAVYGLFRSLKIGPCDQIVNGARRLDLGLRRMWYGQNHLQSTHTGALGLALPEYG